MIKIFSTAVIGTLLASTAVAPAVAQHRGPVVHRNVYKTVTVSRGHKWRKGQRLAANQRRYVVNDWRNRGLRQPPRGYQWVREDNNAGDYLLVAAATGLIASILAQ